MQKMNVNGLDLAYSRQGKGVPLVLVHGYPLDHSIWDKVLPLLEDTFDLIVPDLRGFGDSATTADVYGVENLASDLAALLDQLDVGQAALAGHSMGGYVVLAFARAFPARVRGLGLVSTQALADPPDRKQARYQSAAEVGEKGVGGVAGAMAPKLSADPGLQSYAHELIGKQSPAGLIGALKAMAERPDSSALLKSFQMPVVIIHGESDALIPVDRAREMESAVLQARLFVLKGVGHLPMLEAPRDTAQALKHLA